MMDEEQLRQMILAQQQGQIAPQLNMQAANMPMPNPNLGGGFGGMMNRAGIGIQNGLGRLSQGMFQMDPAATAGMDPSQIKSQRNNAMMQMGLGMMAAGSRPGATLGSSLASGYFGAQDNLQGAMQRGFENAKTNNAEKRALDREQRDTEQQQIGNERYDTARKYQLEQDKLSQQHYEAEQKATAEWRKSQIDAENKRTEMYGSRTAQTVNAMTPEGMDFAAEQYYRTGTMPSLGNGSAAIKAQIISAAAQKAKDEGNSPVASVLNAQANKAGMSAMTQLSKQQTLVSAFEKNATKNADIALAMSEQVDRSGVPLIDRYVNAGRKAGGDVGLSKFQAANDTFVNEYAKVMSGSMGNTAVSDSAREHAHEMLNTAQSKDQYREVVALLKQEMGNRMAGFQEEQASLRTTMAGSGAAQSQQAAPQGMTQGLGQPNPMQQPMQVKRRLNGRTFVQIGDQWFEE